MPEMSSLPENIPELPPAPPRESLISTAVKFLQSTKVSQSPLEQKKQFLLKKGLTDKEIEIAVSRSNSSSDHHVSVPLSNSEQIDMPPVSAWTRIRQYSAIAVIIGGVVYGLYYLYKRFIEPIFLKSAKLQEEKLEKMEEGLKNVQEELTQNMQEIRSSMNEMQDHLGTQNAKLGQVAANLTSFRQAESGYGTVSNSAIGELKAEITSIKGLLLSRNQFPAQPLPKPIIPSWQMKPTSEPLSLNGSTSPTSAKEDEDHADESPDENGSGDNDSGKVQLKKTPHVNGFMDDATDVHSENEDIPVITGS
uniref:peroxisomal membrane protein PEX14-like isoform X1 n=1 Tax=Styela clava TaxID=7725 RepID=UPI0019398F2E|nr:peroxisomal membrane protein PEX14-like isoform X1 [Styela clava]